MCEAVNSGTFIIMLNCEIPNLRLVELPFFSVKTFKLLMYFGPKSYFTSYIKLIRLTITVKCKLTRACSIFLKCKHVRNVITASACNQSQ